MTSLKPYPTYRDSGANWLGQVPICWGTPRLKRVSRLAPSKSELPALDDDHPVSFVPMERLKTDGTLDATRTRPFSEVRSGLTYFSEGDVLLAKITPCFENGKSAVARGLKDGFGFGSTEYHVIRAGDTVAPEFLYRIVSSKPFLLMGEEFMEGSAGQKRVPTDFVANVRIPLPPLEEQRAIAAFLDAMDARITRFIAARQKMIRLLEEKKQAVINQAVTKGLDPTVPMKDSGVDWLGEIPAHWEVQRLGSILTERRETNESSQENRVLSVLRGRGVIPYAEKGNIGNKASEDTSRYKIVKNGDLVLNSMNVIIGSLGISRLDGCLSPVYYVLRPVANAAVSMDFYERLFQLSVFHKTLIRIGNGILAHRMRIPMEKLKAEPLPLPPVDEQDAIVEHINHESAGLDAVASQHLREIELMQEYRTRLISDVVTGKLDVRGVDPGKLLDLEWIPEADEPMDADEATMA